MYPALSEMEDILARKSGCQIQVEPFLLPADMADQFFMTGWRHPEWYLDSLFRQGVSPLANAPAGVVKKCVRRLESDLNTGAWQEKYGRTLKQFVYDGGYRFLLASCGSCNS